MQRAVVQQATCSKQTAATFAVVSFLFAVLRDTAPQNRVLSCLRFGAHSLLEEFSRKSNPGPSGEDAIFLDQPRDVGSVRPTLERCGIDRHRGARLIASRHRLRSSGAETAYHSTGAIMANRYNASSTKASEQTAGYLHRPPIHSTLKKSFNTCALLCRAKCAVVIVLALLLVATSGPAYAESGRIQITVDKTGYGSGNLFYEAQKYGLSISGIKVSGFRITKIELTGSALNLNSAADIVGTYAGGDAGVSIVGRAKTARLENPKGVVLEIQGVNLSRKFTLNLDGITIKTLGWQTSQE
jgi:hypothetical protein